MAVAAFEGDGMVATVNEGGGVVVVVGEGFQNMEDIEIDQIVDVPDTPDRLAVRHIIDRKYVNNPDVVDEKNEKRIIAENGKNRRLAIRPVNNSNNDKVKNSSNCIHVSSSNKSHASQNAPIFRRAPTGNIFVHERTHSNGAGKMEKGKSTYTKFPSESSSHDDISVLDLTEENGLPQRLKQAFSHESKDIDTQDKIEWNTSIGSPFLPHVSDSFNRSSNAYPGKCKIEVNSHPGSIDTDRGKSIQLSGGSPQKREKQLSLHPCVSSRVNGQRRLVRNGCISPHNIATGAKQLTELNSNKINENEQSSAGHVSGQKRLVRNGCISPHNIATRAKQWTEQNSNKVNDNEQSHSGHAVSSDTVSPISIDDIIAEEKGGSRAKGKEVLIHPSSCAHDAITIDGVTDSSPVINCEKADDSTHSIRNALNNFSVRPDGWRTTGNHRSTAQPIYEVTGHHSSRNNDFKSHISAHYEDRLNTRHAGSSHRSKNLHGPLGDRADQATSMIISEPDQLTGPRPAAGTLTKRQRKGGSTSRVPNGVSDNSEIIFLGSSGESSTSGLDAMNNDDSDARARQLEADEILARELQEQLYQEGTFGVGETDEHVAWELQQDEGLFHTFTDHHTSRPRWLQRATSNRQPRLPAHQNPLNRRRAGTQAPRTNRISQLRRGLSHSPTRTISSRGRNLRFPFNMDVDMRLNILEALEDLSDMGMSEDIFQVQRDFNENDYEMLLALDENNHQHAGASSNQISSLPQSTIQTDNFTEACAICLETPVKGETIRHLPCLHKFHKDCIDPWLRRKTSCPVCKSSIT
ncbi:hypothetical protein L6164_013221 [Bauhinia variegata]|uniref:Uncharacterized protein n=1 Tax=Bauhinia variegata TaxID=167791 RepID=A0ACB9PCS2_BAUVA|nr:hypothetical protein L6164_013221 [Bauhinia variegata]